MYRIRIGKSWLTNYDTDEDWFVVVADATEAFKAKSMDDALEITQWLSLSHHVEARAEVIRTERELMDEIDDLKRRISVLENPVPVAAPPADDPCSALICDCHNCADRCREQYAPCDENGSGQSWTIADYCERAGEPCPSELEGCANWRARSENRPVLCAKCSEPVFGLMPGETCELCRSIDRVSEQQDINITE